MSEKTDPAEAASGVAKRAEREARVAEQMRANLKKRKARQRAREAAAEEDGAGR